MKPWRSIRLIFPLLLILMIAAGCPRYGKVRLESQYGSGMTIEKLVNSWDRYAIYSADYRRPGDTGGLIFDPKDNGRTLTGDAWKKVEDRETLSRLISSMGPYRSRLYQIIGPDGAFFGYIFLRSYNLRYFIKEVDAQTLYVSDIEPQIHGIR